MEILEWIKIFRFKRGVKNPFKILGNIIIGKILEILMINGATFIIDKIIVEIWIDIKDKIIILVLWDIIEIYKIKGIIDMVTTTIEIIGIVWIGITGLTWKGNLIDLKNTMTTDIRIREEWIMEEIIKMITREIIIQNKDKINLISKGILSIATEWINNLIIIKREKIVMRIKDLKKGKKVSPSKEMIFSKKEIEINKNNILIKVRL